MRNNNPQTVALLPSNPLQENTVATTTTAAKAFAPDVIGVPLNQAAPDMLINQLTAISGTVEGDEPVLRVAYVDDDSAVIVPEGDAIDEANPTLSEVTVNTVKIAQLLRVSYELYAQSSTAQLLSGSVSRALTKKADDLLVNGDTTAGVTGLADTTGIYDAGDVNTDLDPLVDAVAHIEEHGGQATAILVAPSTWKALRTLKTATSSNESLLGAGTEDAQRMLLSLPVYTSSAVAADSGLVLDSTAIVSAVGAVRVATSDSIYFDSDSIGVRATFRSGFSVVKPDRIAKFAIAAEG